MLTFSIFNKPINTTQIMETAFNYIFNHQWLLITLISCWITACLYTDRHIRQMEYTDESVSKYVGLMIVFVIYFFIGIPCAVYYVFLAVKSFFMPAKKEY